MTSYKETTKESYQATAKEYARNVADLAPMESIQNFIASLPPKAKIIDIGCGSGRDAKIFTEMRAKVLGIDFSSNLINIAKAYAPLAEFQLMDIEMMDFPAASFDGAWAACSLVHIAKNNLPTVMDKIYSLLKKGGYFYLALKKGIGETFEKDPRYNGNHHKFCSFYEEDELKNILLAAQFKIHVFEVIKQAHGYQSHPAFKIYCQK